MIAFANFRRRKGAGPTLPISPLEGEMSGRTEGGAAPPAYRTLAPRREPQLLADSTSTGFSL